MNDTVDRLLAALRDRARWLLIFDNAERPGDPEDPAGWAAYARLTPHVLAAAPLGDHSSAHRQLVPDTSRYLETRGDVHGSRAVAEPVLDRWREVLGPDHPDTLTAASRLTFDLMRLGEAQPARLLGEDTLQRNRRVLGPEHPLTLWAAATLTDARIAAGEAASARALSEDTLQRSRRVLGPDDPTTLLAAAALTVALVRLGEVESARVLGEDTLQRCRRVLDPDHPITRYLAQVAVTDHPLLGDDAAEDDPSPPQ